MNKNRLVEVIVTVIFIGSLLLHLLFGFWYFAGFEYAPTINKFIFAILTINICMGLLYFVYRFIKWVVKGAIEFEGRFLSKRSQPPK